MVYKLSQPKGKSKWSMVRALLDWKYLLIAVLPFLVYRYVLEISFESSIWLSALVVLLMCPLIYWQSTQWSRRVQEIGAWFVTLTEAGVVIETPKTGTKAYVAWQRVEKVHRMGALLVLYLKSGLFYAFPMDDLSDARAEEMHRYCQEHAQKQVPAEKQIAPPADCLTSAPYRRTETTAVRAEMADVLVRQLSPHAARVLLVCMVFLSIGMLYFIWEGLEGHTFIYTVFSVFLAAFLFISIRSYLHPGTRLAKWIQAPEPSEVHVSKDAVLVMTPGAAWGVLPVAQLSRAWKMRHSYIYEGSKGGVFALAVEEQVPAFLPQPQKPPTMRRFLLVALCAVVIPVSLLLGALGAGLLSGADEKASREAFQRGEALADYVEALTPVQGYPGAIQYCTLWCDEDTGYSVLSVIWEDETSFHHVFPPSDREEAESAH